MDLNQDYIIIGAIILIILFLMFYIPFGLWFAATISGVKISVFQLILMKVRKSPIQEIVKGLIVSEKGGLNLNREELEAFRLTGGNIQNVVNGMVAAKKAGLKLSFKNAAKADSQGIDILKAVKDKFEKQQEKEIKFE
ncbi:MAG: flotillin-like FloA family protein [Draconibacterium sp.]|nr:flotillin-like FloA family protein [Draconibacterium sp.]